MPIVLTGLFKAFTGGVKKIETLTEAMERGSTVLARQRGAFLVSWFGPGVPMEGLAVRAHVVNSDAIATKIRHANQAQAAHRRQEMMPNLVEPVMGAGGVLIGGAVGAVAGVLLVIGLSWGVLAGLFVALGGISRSGSSRTDTEPTEEAPSGAIGPGFFDSIDAMGRDSARLVASVTGVANDLVADRSDVANPVTRAILTLGDRMAAVATRAVGAAAAILSSLPPFEILKSLIAPLKQFVETMADVVMAIIDSMISAFDLRLLLTTTVRRLLRSMPDFLDVWGEVKGFGRAAIDAVLLPFVELRAGGSRILDEAIEVVRDQVTSHPVYRLFQRTGDLKGPLADLGRGLRDLISAIGTNITPTPLELIIQLVKQIPGLGSGGSSAPTPSSGGTGAALLGHVRAFVPRPPTPPVLLTPTVGPALVAAAEAEVDARPMRIVGSVSRTFSGQLAEQRRRGRTAMTDPNLTAATALIDNAARLAGLDTHVERAWGHLADLERPLGSLPVQDPQPPRRIIPIIGKLRVTGPADREADVVEDWARLIPRRMALAPVPIPVGAAEGGG